MIPVIFFIVGIVFTLIEIVDFCMEEVRGEQPTKPSLPFLLFLAAAVAKYIDLL
jgi:hypothetical protein